MEFYPSVTETILDNALSFAKQHVGVSDKDLRIINTLENVVSPRKWNMQKEKFR